jgi:hypothetical protein
VATSVSRNLKDVVVNVVVIVVLVVRAGAVIAIVLDALCVIVVLIVPSICTSQIRAVGYVYCLRTRL